MAVFFFGLTVIRTALSVVEHKNFTLRTRLSVLQILQKDITDVFIL